MSRTLQETVSERNWRVAREEREREPFSTRGAVSVPGRVSLPEADADTHADYAIYILDADGRIMSWNAGAERLEGHLPRQYAGQNVDQLYPDEDQRAQRPRLALQQAMQSGRFEERGWRLRPDGSRFRAHIIIDLIRNRDGHPAGFVKTIRDVSENHATQLRLHDLHTANRELEQFIHIASHDLREPLRKLETFNGLLRSEEGERLSDDARAYLDNMMAATQRMQALLASLLQLTRVTSQGQAFRPVDLDAVVNDVCNDLTVLIQESGCNMQVGTLGSIDGDAAQLRQLFQNLISNGIKYAAEGVAPEIHISAAPSEDASCRMIIVQDNGIGFDPSYREKIFGVFQRLHGRDKYPGTGIGLSICRKICERHGGRISARSQPGQGARFTLELPVQHEDVTSHV